MSDSKRIKTTIQEARNAVLAGVNEAKGSIINHVEECYIQHGSVVEGSNFLGIEVQASFKTYMLDEISKVLKSPPKLEEE